MSRATYPSLVGRHVVVTGGATGIGAALVTAFARQGAQVTFYDIADEAGEALAVSLDGARYARVDLTDLDALSAAMTRDCAGGIDVLVNNAASDTRHEWDAVTPADWDDRIAVNLRHLFFAAQAAARVMVAQGRGVILNLGSISWHLALPSLALYQTAKAGIEGMTRGLARDLGANGIRVCTIVPGNVDTPRQRMWHDDAAVAEILAAQCLKARVQPDDVAALALFLASDDARMCTGHSYFVDGGWR
jgi:D-xylose 1-dehydrogenase